MSQWVNNYAVLQDLSVAQGRGVPVRINGVVAGDGRRPALHINEGVEDQFFRHYMGGRDPRAASDLGFIQQMLQAVNLGNPPPRHPVSNVTNSMLNPNCAEFVPQYGSTLNNSRYDNRPFTNMRDRNVAIDSLLEADSEKHKFQHAQLLKPDDIMQTNGTFDHHLAPTYFAPMPPTATFKKRNPVPKISVLETTLEQNNNTYYLDAYQQSELAMEYYNKSLERTKIRTSVKHDIWAKAEEKMREAERRRQQSEQLCIEWAFKNDNENLNLVRLPYHRHVVVVECVVCEMVKKHIGCLEKFMPFARGM